MSKIIFVGLHNKPGMQPLDSKTKSGKLIDRIIDTIDPIALFLAESDFIKTNLFDIEYYPKNDDENFARATEWWSRVKVNDIDRIVLLGALVQKDFVNCLHKNIIKIAHPASKRSHKAMNEYVEETIKLLQP